MYEHENDGEPTAAERWQKILDAPVEELELGVRAYNFLKRQGIDSCGQVLRLDLIQAGGWTTGNPPRTMGRAAVEEIRQAQAGLASTRVQLQADEDGEQGGGLSEEQRTQVLHAATSGLLDLLIARPELARLGADDLTLVFLAGVNAGVDAFDRVLTVGLRDRGLT